MIKVSKFKYPISELTLGGIITTIFISLKLWYRNTNAEDLLFLLSPVNKIVKIFTGSISDFKPQEGYFFKDLDIIIDKSCSGFNFLLISFLMISFLLIPRYNRLLLKISAIIASGFIAYIITLIANTSRIITSIFAEKMTPISWGQYYSIIHQSIGVIIYLSCLVSFYLLIDKIITKKLSL